MHDEYRTISPTTLMAPLPVVLVTCAGKDAEGQEKTNAFTVAWTGIVNTRPPMVSISVKPERFSYHLIADGEEFVINLVDRGLLKAADFCGVKSGRNMDKLDRAGLHTRKAIGMQNAPALEGGPASLSCRIQQKIPLGSHDLFIAEVVGVEVRSDLFDPDGSLHLERAGLVCYSHGVYQGLDKVLGFFGYSVARPEILKRRMQSYTEGKSRVR